jgi:hypothetical protein
LDDNFRSAGAITVLLQRLAGVVVGCEFFQLCFADISGMYQFEADAFFFEKSLD